MDELLEEIRCMTGDTFASACSDELSKASSEELEELRHSFSVIREHLLRQH